MKKLSLRTEMFRLPAANMIANMIGVVIVNKLIFKNLIPLSSEVSAKITTLDWIFPLIACFAVAGWTIWYERPITRFIVKKGEKGSISPGLRLESCRRLLNYPFYVMGVDIVVWFIAAIVYAVFFWMMGFRPPLLLQPIFVCFNTGLVTATIVFLITEHIVQRHLISRLFPDESLSSVPGTIRVKIGIRLVMILIACNLIPLSAVLQAVYLSKGAITESVPYMEGLYSALTVNAFVFMALGICVIQFVGMNMTLPFKDIIRVLKAIKSGRLDRKIQVTTNDEIGYTGDVINNMTEGLKEREQMRQALGLAREVQLNLLPKSFPKRNWIDIAGKSIYCDQTGGDYFDFLDLDASDPDSVRERIGLVVGDVSGHGISSALLMTTARAFLRFRFFRPGSISQAVSDVNRQLAKDIGDSGQFMTLFYMVVDADKKTLNWVRAGHDPAILYDPGTDRFETLSGNGIALGVMEDCTYEEKTKSGLCDGQIILIGTDGIWEACNSRNEMFGKEPIYEIIRENHHASASELVDMIIRALDRFLDGYKAEDDITLIVIKMLNNG